MANIPIIVPSNKEPTFWNKDAAVGFILFDIPGMIIGGFIGKNRMQKEQIQGKIVSEPTAWNKSAVIGYGLASYIGVAIMLMIGAPVTLGTASLVLGGAVLGGIIGGGQGKDRMEQEYVEAQAYVAQYGNYSPNKQQGLAQEKQLESSYKNTVTPEEAKLLEERLSAAKDKPRDMEQVRLASGVSR